MKFKSLVPVAMIAAALMGVSGDAYAKNNNKKSLLIGGVAGVAVGAIGATMYNKSQQQQAAPQPEYTGSTARPVSYQQQGCAAREVDLFDRQGNFVKKERMRVCH